MKNPVATFNHALLTRTSGAKVLAALALTVIAFVVMAFVVVPPFQEATNGLRPFDLNRGINAALMYEELPFYTDESRRLYAWFAVADFAYPAAAAVFFTLLWAWLFNRWPNRLFDRLCAAGVLLVPCLFALVDWLENIGFLIVVFGYPEEFREIGNMAGALKAKKSYILYALMIVSIVFAGISILSRRKP